MMWLVSAMMRLTYDSPGENYYFRNMFFFCLDYVSARDFVELKVEEMKGDEESAIRA